MFDYNREIIAILNRKANNNRTNQAQKNYPTFEIVLLSFSFCICSKIRSNSDKTCPSETGLAFLSNANLNHFITNFLRLSSIHFS